ncbi:MAG: hypothetical protein PHI45_03375 [Candidatus Pacebacteria bacterium]|nr:hypothetical protein [Candidatus Paceibacterota bacterium]MDD5753093.1 hypothetical protein [Candidatus Paceibacterota bacterium]
MTTRRYIPVSTALSLKDPKSLRKMAVDLEKEEGVQTIVKEGYLIFYTNVNGKGYFKIPPCIKNTEGVRCNNFLLLEEKGGANKTGGSATIVCGNKGEKIKPFQIKAGTARFVQKSAVLITAENNGTDIYAVKIESLKISEEEKKGTIQTHRSLIFEDSVKKIWFDDDFIGIGSYEDTISIPNEILTFYFAVREAVRKSRCVGCKRPHYVKIEKPTRRYYYSTSIQESQASCSCLC